MNWIRPKPGVDLERTRLTFEVRSAFYHVLAAQRLVELRRKQSALADDAAETAHQLANTGVADRPDVLQAEVEQQHARLSVETAQQNLRGAWRVLAATVGKPGLPQSPVSGDLDALPILLYEESVALALRQSPEIQLARQAIARAEAAADYARRVAIPDLTLNATLANNFEPLENTGRSTGLQGGAQIGVQIPLFNRNQGNIASSRAEIETARAALAAENLRLERLLSGLFQEFESARDSALIYRREILPRAAEVLRLHQGNYQGMSGAYPPVLMAQRSLFQLELDALHSLEAAWQSALSIQTMGVSGSPPRLKIPR